MKHPLVSFSIVLLLIVLFNTSLCAQQNKALVYMEKINKELNAIMEDTWDYTSEVAHGKSARKAEVKRKILVRTSKMAMDKVSKMAAFDGNSQYRDSVVSYLQINYHVLNADFEKILNMEEIAEQSYDLMEAYLLAQELANEKLDLAGEWMEEQEELFAKANNINLVESKNKIAKKLEKAGKVVKHYNEVYLIFFKSYKQEAYLMDAMSRKDVNAMEQNKNALLTVSAEGLGKIKNLVPYKSDKSLIWSVKDALDFYNQEAASKMDKLIEYYLQQEKFDKIKAAFDAKVQSTRTREDVNQFNTAVAEMNKQSAAFNRLNTDLNNSRNRVIDDWNKSADSFLNRHVPRRK
jgi:hypothetical protein